jgi:hypothetical protein
MKLLTLITAVLLAPSLVWAGKETGGGKGVVCRDSAGAILSAEVLDLWEARMLYKQKLSAPSGSVNDMVKAALTLMGHAITSDGMSIDLWSQSGNPNAPKQHFEGPDAVMMSMYLQTGVFNLPDGEDIRRLRGVRLALTEDSFEEITPSSCAIEQIVRYQDFSVGDGSILIDQAALIVHEAAYKYFRDSYKETNSLRIRRAVGMAFSGHTFASLNAKLLPDEYYVCISNPKDFRTLSRVFVFRLPSTDPNPKTDRDGIVFQVDKLVGRPMIDNGVITEIPNQGGVLVNSFVDFTNLKGGGGVANTNGIVQPEIRASVTVTQAGRKKLSLTVAAKPSPHFPQGVSAVPLKCEYKKR